jgi:hypothetical protein
MSLQLSTYDADAPPSSHPSVGCDRRRSLEPRRCRDRCARLAGMPLAVSVDRVLDVAWNISQRKSNDALLSVATFALAERGVFTARERRTVPEDVVLDAWDGHLHVSGVVRRPPGYRHPNTAKLSDAALGPTGVSVLVHRSAGSSKNLNETGSFGRSDSPATSGPRPELGGAVPMPACPQLERGSLFDSRRKLPGWTIRTAVTLNRSLPHPQQIGSARAHWHQRGCWHQWARLT